MSDTKHTPGPWKYTQTKTGCDYGISAPGCSNVLAEVYEEFIGRGVYEPLEARANARLIAAAPELLAALEKCMEYIPGSEVRSWPPGFRLKDAAVRAALAAIAKARGK